MATIAVTYSITPTHMIQAIAIFNGRNYQSVGADRIEAVQRLTDSIRNDQLRSSMTTPGPELITV